MTTLWSAWLQVALLAAIAGAAALWAGGAWRQESALLEDERTRLAGLVSLRDARRAALDAFRESRGAELLYRETWDADLQASRDAAAAGALLDRLAAEHGVALVQRGAPRDLPVAGRAVPCIDVRVRGDFRSLVVWIGAVQGGLRAARWTRLALEPEGASIALEATLAFPPAAEPGGGR